MALSTPSSIVEYVSDGAQLEYAVPFRFLANAHVRVLTVDPNVEDDEGTELVEGTDYSLSGQGNPSGGQVTLSAAADADLVVQVRRVVPIIQGSSLRTSGTGVKTLEDALDYLTMVAQQLNDGVIAAGGVFNFAASDANEARVTARGGSVPRTLADHFGDEVHTRNFGAVGDGITDDTAAIQRAIDYAIYTSHAKVILDPGKYKTSDTLHLGYGESFHSVVLEGAIYNYNAFGEVFCGAAILPTFADRPCINVQGARGTALRGVALIGKLVTWISSNVFCIAGSPALLDDTDGDNWNGDDAYWAAQLGHADVERDALVDARYAPYAGVTVDAYSGARPATSYPNVTYPAALGAVAQYGKAFSSDVLIEDCQISGFTVGVANQPCDADGNGDFTVIRRVLLDSCKWGISVCNTQSRNVDIDNVKYSFVHTMLTNHKHGRRNGKFNGAIKNLSGGASIQVFDFVGTSIAGPIEFTNLYSEAMWRVGTVALPTEAETSIRFRQSLISFELQDDVRGIPAYVLDGAQQPCDVVMSGSAMVDFRSVWGTNLPIICDGAFFFTQDRAQSVPLAPYARFAQNFLLGGFMPSPQLGYADLPQRIHHALLDLDSGALNANAQSGDSYRPSTRSTCIPMHVRTTMPRNDRWRVEDLVPQGSGNALRKNVFFSAVDLTDRVLTLTCVSLPDHYAQVYGLLPGDILWDDETGTVFFIRSRTGTTVIAEQQNNYRSDGGGGWVCLAPFTESSAGYLYSLNTRFYSPQYSLEGTLVAGSADIEAHRADGDASFLESDIKVGDRLFLNSVRDCPFAEDLGNVVARDNVAKTITLGGVALFDQDRRPLSYWIRTGPANRGTR